MTTLLLLAITLLAALLVATLTAAARLVDQRDRWMVRAWRAEDELERAYRDVGEGS